MSVDLSLRSGTVGWVHGPNLVYVEPNSAWYSSGLMRAEFYVRGNKWVSVESGKEILGLPPPDKWVDFKDANEF